MAKERISKLNVWFKHYINESCSTTFLNKKEAARAAKYNCTTEESYRSVGYQNFIKCADKIKKWLNEYGLSENALKLKLLSLMEAKETKFFSFQGEIIEQVDVEALETQRKTLDMALKVKGMNAPTKHELTGGDGVPLFKDPETEMRKRGIPIPKNDIKDVNE